MPAVDRGYTQGLATSVAPRTLPSRLLSGTEITRQGSRRSDTDTGRRGDLPQSVPRWEPRHGKGNRGATSMVLTLLPNPPVRLIELSLGGYVFAQTGKSPPSSPLSPLEITPTTLM